MCVGKGECVCVLSRKIWSGGTIFGYQKLSAQKRDVIGPSVPKVVLKGISVKCTTKLQPNR